MPKVLGLSFTPRIFERGQEYFEKGKVGPIEWDEQIFSATVIAPMQKTTNCVNIWRLWQWL